MKTLAECVVAFATALQEIPNQDVETSFVAALRLDFPDGDKYNLDFALERLPTDG